MSNPWNRAAAGTPLVWPNGANASPGPDNFSGLANGQAKCLGVIQPASLSAPFGDVIIPPWKITFASAAFSAGGTFTRYIFGSEDNTTPVWPANINPTSTSDQYGGGTGVFGYWQSYNPGGFQSAQLDQLVMVSGVTTYYTDWFPLRGLFTGGNIPTFITVLCFNQSGVALAAYSSGNQVTTYVTETYN